MADLTLVNRLIHGIEVAQGGKFKLYATLLRGASFVDKPWWFLLKRKTACTTVGSTVYLCKDFYQTDDWHKSRWLLHEAVHLRQYREKGLARFLYEYSSPDGRAAIENEAYDIAGGW